MTASTLLTVGYEGRTAEEVVATLQAARVTVLVDVRLTPVSRKPGLSRRLSERLDGEGIRYVHMPGLGNPRDNRARCAPATRLPSTGSGTSWTLPAARRGSKR